MNDSKITQAEMIEMFGSKMPMEAVELVWNAPSDMTLGQIRNRLREIAQQKKDAQSGVQIDWKAFGKEVFDARRYVNVGVRTFAGDLGLNKSTICRIENGKPCDVPKYLTICKLLEIDPWQFTTET